MPSEGAQDATPTTQYEVEVQCLWAGSTAVEAESAEEAIEKVENLEDSEIIFNDMTPESVETRGVYRLDE